MAKSPLVPPAADSLTAAAPVNPAPANAPIDAPGERTADTLAAADERLADALAHRSARLSPPAADPIAPPLPPVQPFGTKGAPDRPAPVADAMFDRRHTIEALLTHPSAEVRQRAEEARVAIHHSAADMGIKMRAAIDVARGAESRR